MILMACLAASLVTAAQPEAPPARADPDVTWRAWDDAVPPPPLWQLRLEAGVWYAAAAGEIRLPGSLPASASTSLADLNLDSPSIGPGGIVALRRGPWRLTLGGSTNSLENGSTMEQPGQIGNLLFSAGDFLDSQLRLSTLEATVGYRLFEARRGPEDNGGSRVMFGVDATAGLRAHGFELDVSGPGGTAGVDEWFLEPVIGAALDIELWKKISVDLAIQAGTNAGIGGKDAASGDIAVGFEWRPWNHVGLRVGYRLMSMSLGEGEGTDEFEFQGSNAGLIFGLSARF